MNMSATQEGSLSTQKGVFVHCMWEAVVRCDETYATHRVFNWFSDERPQLATREEERTSRIAARLRLPPFAVGDSVKTNRRLKRKETAGAFCERTILTLVIVQGSSIELLSKHATFQNINIRHTANFGLSIT